MCTNSNAQSKGQSSPPSSLRIRWIHELFELVMDISIAADFLFPIPVAYNPDKVGIWRLILLKTPPYDEPRLGGTAKSPKSSLLLLISEGAVIIAPRTIQKLKWNRYPTQQTAIDKFMVYELSVKLSLRGRSLLIDVLSFLSITPPWKNAPAFPGMQFSSRILTFSAPKRSPVSRWTKLVLRFLLQLYQEASTDCLSLFRVHCNNTNGVGVVYLLVLMGVMTKLHNIRTYETGHLLVKVSTYNFTANHQTFTISFILSEGSNNDNGDDICLVLTHYLLRWTLVVVFRKHRLHEQLQVVLTPKKPPAQAASKMAKKHAWHRLR
ncbi:unnamed protein product [Brassica rapa]|uniref:Uncharacterized protein n=1 Tax=Brassica campestris TaxID=3711 RepID=A0A8D9HJJ3_BRACM|nr:unnamed protein product [Brassica rapa]